MSDEERSSIDSEEFNNWDFLVDGKIPELRDSPGEYQSQTKFWTQTDPTKSSSDSKNFGIIPSREEVRKYYIFNS